MEQRITVERAIAADPAAIFAVLTSPEGHVAIDGVTQPPIGHVYGYELEPIEGGTMVRAYYDWSDLHEAYRELAQTLFPVISETNLRATLGILARTVAPGKGRPGATSTPKGGAAVDTGNR